MQLAYTFARGVCTCRLPVFRSEAGMFAFYSNRLGCAGSVVVSAIGTLILAAVAIALTR